MNQRSISRLAAVVATFGALDAAAAVTPNPYARIAGSNVFRLQAPALQTKPNPELPPRKSLTTIFITGLVELGGVPKALVEIAVPGQPVKRPILASGGTCDLLEILSIDVPGESVRVRLDGEEQSLSIEKPKVPTTAPPQPPVPAPLRASVAIRG